MPFKSKAQRRFMYAQHPELAQEFEAATPAGKKLPEKVAMACLDELNRICLTKLAQSPTLDTASSVPVALPRERKERLPPGVAAGLGVTGAIGGSSFSGLSGAAAERAALEEAKGRAGGLLERVRASSPVPVTPLESGAGPAYVSEDVAKLMKRIGGPKEMQREQIMMGAGQMSKAPGVLGHEIGHARLQRSALGRLAQSVPSRALFNLTNLGVTGVASGIGASGVEDPVTGALVAGGVPLATTIPTLGSEAGASIKGIGELRRAGASPAQIAAAKKTLLRAFGTYGGTALKGTGLGLGAYGVARAIRKRGEE